MDVAALLIRNVLFPAWVRKNRSARLAYLAEFERTQFQSADELRDQQWGQFRAVLRHAFDHCVFYRKKLSAVGMTPDDIRAPDDISKLPTTSKQEIQESLDELIADTVSRDSLIRDMTGGSTGFPLVFYYDKDRFDSRVGAMLRHDRWTGWNIGDAMAVLWGARRDLVGKSLKGRMRTRFIDRRIMLDASAIDEDRMHQFCHDLRRHRPQFILAYANTMALFARFVREVGEAPIQPRAIICSAELLTSENRALIESTFGCQVYNRYGSREFAVIASECSSHQGMHINAENLLVEVVPGRPASTDGEGEILITDLKNYAMPMIRYRTMDVGRLMPPCSCGRGLPVLELSGGRSTDFLTAISGQKVSGIAIATYVITNIPGIRQIQFVQQRPDGVLVRLAQGPDWSSETVRQLTARIRSFLGDAMTVDIELVSEIPLEQSGKYRFSISTIPA
ncbi:MAG: phenylacetate--CoA ligase family protein [Vicinamibacteraceae bacterium]